MRTPWFIQAKVSSAACMRAGEAPPPRAARRTIRAARGDSDPAASAPLARMSRLAALEAVGLVQQESALGPQRDRDGHRGCGVAQRRAARRARCGRRRTRRTRSRRRRRAAPRRGRRRRRRGRSGRSARARLALPASGVALRSRRPRRDPHAALGDAAERARRRRAERRRRRRGHLADGCAPRAARPRSTRARRVPRSRPRPPRRPRRGGSPGRPHRASPEGRIAPVSTIGSAPACRTSQSTAVSSIVSVPCVTTTPRPVAVSSNAARATASTSAQVRCAPGISTTDRVRRSSTPARAGIAATSASTSSAGRARGPAIAIVPPVDRIVTGLRVRGIRADRSPSRRNGPRRGGACAAAGLRRGGARAAAGPAPRRGLRTRRGLRRGGACAAAGPAPRRALRRGAGSATS